VNNSSIANPALAEGRSERAAFFWWACTETGVIAYFFTAVVVLWSVYLGLDLPGGLGQRPPSSRSVSGDDPFLVATTRWDGQHYLEIASQGYSYEPDRASSVAFFPLYPMLVAAVFRGTGMPLEWAGLLVAHVLLIAAFVLLAAYASQRYARASGQLVAYAVLAFGVFPTTFFMRMSYSESTFLVLALLAMFGMERGWRPIVVVAIVGLATASRSVGVALVPVVWLYVWRRAEAGPHPQPLSRKRARGVLNWLSRKRERGGLDELSRSAISEPSGPHPQPLSRKRERGVLNRLARIACLTPVALWGLLAYMAFQYAEFGEPLAFAKTQSHWRGRPDVPWGEKALALAAWEPIWSAYMPSSPGYAGRYARELPAWCNLQMANPVFFVAAAALVGLGAAKRWLSGREILLAAGLLLIPYVTRGFDMCMASQGRFAGVVFPVYLVLGRLLCGAPPVVAVGVFALSAVYLAVYAALFAAGYVMI